MKKKLFLMAVLAIFAFTSCEKDPIPPVVEDVLETYSTDKLIVEVGGAPVGADAKVELVQLQDKSLTIKLSNIIPGVAEFSIPDAKFEAATKIVYISKITGETSDNISGYDVKFEGVVDEGVLTASITCTEIAGVRINTKNAGLLSKIFKGEMKISIPGMAVPVKMEQRVYTSAPKDKDTSKMKIQINDFSFEGLSLGNISLDTILVVQRGVKGDVPVYAFQAEDREIVLDGIGNVDLDIKGTIINGEINLSLLVNAPAVSMIVNVDFSGAMTDESTSTSDVEISITSPIIADPVTVSGNIFTFKIWDNATAEQMVLTPTISFKEKTTLDSVVIYDKSHTKIKKITENTPIDFSTFKTGDYVGYHVKAEDIRTRVKKSLMMVTLPQLKTVFDMQTWVTDTGNKKPTPEGLTNSNMAATFLPLYGITIPYPVIKAEDNAAEITTSRTVSPTTPNTLIPGITAGTLYLGTFNLNMSNTLKSTRFGAPYQKEPVKFKVSYKYAPGSVFSETVVRDSLKNGKTVKYHTTEVMPNEKDECSINAYLYEVASYDEYLDGTNVNTSTKVVLRATVTDVNPSSDYLTKELDFVEVNGNKYDPAKKYKLAIVCSSSKRGDEFKGAEGSKLWVKYLEVVPK